MIAVEPPILAQAVLMVNVREFLPGDIGFKTDLSMSGDGYPAVLLNYVRQEIDGGNVRRPTNTKTGNAFAVATLLRDGALILNVLGHAESTATEVLLHWMEIARERINTEQPQK